MPGSPTIFNTGKREVVAKRLDKYFELCKKAKKVPSLTGLALYLGTTRMALTEYSKTDEYGDLVIQAKLRCENVLEERMINGTPPTGIIFILKNNYGWKDKVEVDQTINGTISLASLFDQASKVRQLQNTSNVIDAEVVEQPALIDEHTGSLPEELF
jgi:hypothetical protein